MIISEALAQRIVDTARLPGAHQREHHEAARG